MLDVYERVLGEAGRVGADHRWRVIHAQVVHPDDFAGGRVVFERRAGENRPSGGR